MFETATIADSVKKASAVAPAKGQAFDKAAGVLMEFSDGGCIVKATNLQVFYMEWVDVVEVDGDFTWRLPAALLASVLGSLPIGSGKQVTIEQKENTCHISQGRTRARINLISNEYYPIWTAFDPDSLVQASGLGNRLKQVTWAASANAADQPFNGVHFSGDVAVATDRYRCAAVPLEIPNLQAPVTIPGDLLLAALSRSGDVAVGVVGDQLLVMPDEHTQVRCMCFGAKYPKVSNIMKRDHPQTIQVNRTDVLEIMTRALNFAGSDRVPVMKIFLGQGEIAVMMTNAEVGLLGDVVEVPGYADHPRVELRFTPKNLMDALTASPNDQVTINYDPDKPNNPLRVDGGSGYEAWIAPRAENQG